jgi:hypothetical protein
VVLPRAVGHSRQPRRGQPESGSSWVCSCLVRGVARPEAKTITRHSQVLSGSPAAPAPPRRPYDPQELTAGRRKTATRRQPVRALAWDRCNKSVTLDDLIRADRAEHIPLPSRAGGQEGNAPPRQHRRGALSRQPRHVLPAPARACRTPILGIGIFLLGGRRLIVTLIEARTPLAALIGPALRPRNPPASPVPTTRAAMPAHPPVRCAAAPLRKYAVRRNANQQPGEQRRKRLKTPALPSISVRDGGTAPSVPPSPRCRQSLHPRLADPDPQRSSASDLGDGVELPDH